MRAAAVQLDIAWEEPAANMTRAAGLIAGAVSDGAELVVLPEMFSTGFSMNTALTAEEPGGRVKTFLAARAREHRVFLAGSVTERAAGGRAENVVYIVGPDGRDLLRYAKVHPFGFAGEDRHFAAGTGLPVAGLRDFRAAVAICYDLRFPELFRALCFRGAGLFIVPANWPDARVAHWAALLRARAIENQAFVIGVNRAGTGGGLTYNGRSAILDPMGRCLAEAGGGEEVIAADMDPALVETTRRAFPFLRDARRDLFPCLWE